MDRSEHRVSLPIIEYEELLLKNEALRLALRDTMLKGSINNGVIETNKYTLKYEVDRTEKGPITTSTLATKFKVK